MAVSYIVEAEENIKVNLSPADEIEEVLQNVRMIIGTMKGTIPLKRNFGIDNEIIDLPMPIARAKIVNEIVKQVRENEPRAIIKRIEMASDMNGSLKPRLELEVNVT